MRIDISNRIGTTSNFGGFRGLLDKFSGAAAGYSLRKLSKSATNAVRVRRSSDNTEQDIGFVGTELDTTTLLDFVNARDVAPADYGAGAAAAYSLRYVSDSYTGDVVRVRRDSDNAEADFNPTEITDGTLLAWVGNTASDNGYVTTWYDQSGNSNDATQGTAASQPKIVDAGVLVEENGKAAVDFFSGASSLNGLVNVGSTITFFATGTIKSILGQKALFELHQSGSNRFIVRNNAGTYNVFPTALSGGTTTTNQVLFSSHINGVVSDAMYIDGVSVDTGLATKASTTDIVIGNDFSGSDNSVVQEIIIFDFDQSSNRGNIEANVNDYYSIYTSTNDGFVTTWYDQAGSNDATQATAAAQPQIVDGGSLITSNGYQVIQYDGTDDNLTTSLTATGTMLMGGSDGSAFYEVAISGSYSLLSSANNTKHPLNESIRVIWGSILTTAQKTAIEAAVTYADWDFSDITSFENYWRLRSELTDFPLIDVNNGSSFRFAWFGCSSLTSFPALDVSSGTNFFRAWNVCSSLQDFPANMFDSVTATDFALAFDGTNLTQTSIDNILVSIDTAGQSGGTFNQSGGSAPSATGEAAIDNLRARGWTVTVTGGY